MTANQFNAALERLGFCSELPNGVMSRGQVEFARRLKIGERSVRRWASGQWPVPTPISALLNLMIKTGTTADDLKV
jgi:hypothetical protein